MHFQVPEHEIKHQPYVNADVVAELGLHGKTEKVTVKILNGQIKTFDTSPVNVELMSGDRKVNMEPLCEPNFYFCIKSSIGTQGEVD